MSKVEALLLDLVSEHEELDAVVADIEPDEWATPTPAEGWAICDQVSHLTYFDASASLALVSPERFEEHKQALFSGELGTTPDLALGRQVKSPELLESWRSGRVDLVDAASAADGSVRVPWYGPPMSLASFITARLMETWAHGQDIRDAIGLPPAVSDRLRHICHLGVAARAYAHAVHGIEDDQVPVRVEVVAPPGVTWAWGPEDATDRITGSALGLALVVTQRRHPDDTDVGAEGPAAARWLSIAQAFAGPAGPGREPGLVIPGPAIPGPAGAGTPTPGES